MNFSVVFGINKLFKVFIVSLLLVKVVFASSNELFLVDSGILREVDSNHVEVEKRTNVIEVDSSMDILFGYVVRKEGSDNFFHSATLSFSKPKEILGDKPESLIVQDDIIKINYPRRYCPGYCFLKIKLTEGDPPGIYNIIMRLDEKEVRKVSFDVRFVE